MGFDKRLISFGGQTLVQLAVDKLRDILAEVTVVLSGCDELNLRDAQIVMDKEKDRGPLMGILTGLQGLRTAYGLVLACDLPLISVEVLSHLGNKVDGEIDMVVPRWGGRVEPLAGIYSKRCLPFLEDMINKERLAPKRLLSETDLRINFVEEEELSLFGEPKLLFFNVNTKEELCEAQKRWKVRDEGID